jgi:osmotically-inducible protein OsmY
MPTDAVVEDEIRASLSRDPRLPVPDEVAVSASEGTVVLRGTVGSLSQRRAAVSDARIESDAAYDDVTTLQGVVGITNEIKVITP